MKKLRKNNAQNNWFEIACALTALCSLAMIMHLAQPNTMNASAVEEDAELAAEENLRDALRRVRVRRADDFNPVAADMDIDVEMNGNGMDLDDEDLVVVPGELAAEDVETQDVDQLNNADQE